MTFWIGIFFTLIGICKAVKLGSEMSYDNIGYFSPWDIIGELMVVGSAIGVGIYLICVGV